MSLTDHAHAFNALSEHLRAASRDAQEDVARALGEGDKAQAAALTSAGLVLFGIAQATSAAAAQLFNEVAADIAKTAAGHRCTFDHATLKGPRCPACGAPKA